MYTFTRQWWQRQHRTIRISLNKLGQVASVHWHNACEVCNAIGRVLSGLGVPAFKYLQFKLYSPASPFSSALSPVSNLIIFWTPSPQCHLMLCIGALHAWAAQPAVTDAASRLCFNDYNSAVALLAQQPLQQVHARDQGRRRSVERTPPARWRWRGRRQ
jgi:hypothetical protein